MPTSGGPCSRLQTAAEVPTDLSSWSPASRRPGQLGVGLHRIMEHLVPAPLNLPAHRLRSADPFLPACSWAPTSAARPSARRWPACCARWLPRRTSKRLCACAAPSSSSPQQNLSWRGGRTTRRRPPCSSSVTASCTRDVTQLPAAGADGSRADGGAWASNARRCWRGAWP